MENDTRRRSTKTDKGLGQNGLYHKLLRDVARMAKPGAPSSVHSKMMKPLEELMELIYNDGNRCKDLSVTDFDVYYQHCVRFFTDRLQITGHDEDKLPFHEQPKQ